MMERLSGKQRRDSALLHAFLMYHAKAVPTREIGSWIYLLTWAALGGKPSEVPKQFGGSR